MNPTADYIREIAAEVEMGLVREPETRNQKPEPETKDCGPACPAAHFAMLCADLVEQRDHQKPVTNDENDHSALWLSEAIEMMDSDFQNKVELIRNMKKDDHYSDDNVQYVADLLFREPNKDNLKMNADQWELNLMRRHIERTHHYRDTGFM